MAHTRPFLLPHDALPELQQMLHKGIHSARTLNRARILLKLHEGRTPTQIATELGLCSNTARNVRQRAADQGWPAALEDKPRTGRPPEITPQTRAVITALACSTPPTGYDQWSFRLLADRAVEFGFTESISHESVRQILKKTT